MSTPAPAVRWAFVAVLLLAPSAHAVPAFARRYGTSCQTCHVAFPKNTPFGDAFRRNAYRFPGGDEDVLQEEPVKLGASANRELFPATVWPGELPRTPPLSATLGSTATFSSTSESKVSLQSLGGVVGLNLAGALGEHLSAWAAISVTGSTAPSAVVAIERAFFTIAPFDKPYLVGRVGRIEPSILSFSTHRTLGLVPWLLSTPIGDNPFSLEPTQLGGEVVGIAPGGRVTGTLGLAEGGGRVNTYKDCYGRLAMKLGGLRFDGVAPAEQQEVANPAPWREWSLQAGAFGYSGRASLGSLQTASQDDRFWTVGGDLNALLGDASVILAYTYTRHWRPLLASPETDTTTRELLAQLDYVVFPWMVPTVRFERRSGLHPAEERYSAGMYLLVRANVRVLLLASALRTNAMGLSFDTGQAGLNVAF